MDLVIVWMNNALMDQSSRIWTISVSLVVESHVWSTQFDQLFTSTRFFDCQVILLRGSTGSKSRLISSISSVSASGAALNWVCYGRQGDGWVDSKTTPYLVLKSMHVLKNVLHDGEKNIFQRIDVFIILNSTNLMDDVSDVTGQMW